MTPTHQHKYVKIYFNFCIINTDLHPSRLIHQKLHLLNLFLSFMLLCFTTRHVCSHFPQLSVTSPGKGPFSSLTFIWWILCNLWLKDETTDNNGKLQSESWEYRGKQEIWQLKPERGKNLKGPRILVGRVSAEAPVFHEEIMIFLFIEGKRPAWFLYF